VKIRDKSFFTAPVLAVKFFLSEADFLKQGTLV
jgi:hypothetical protein